MDRFLLVAVSSYLVLGAAALAPTTWFPIVAAVVLILLIIAALQPKPGSRPIPRWARIAIAFCAWFTVVGLCWWVPFYLVQGTSVGSPFGIDRSPKSAYALVAFFGGVPLALIGVIGWLGLIALVKSPPESTKDPDQTS